MFMDKLKGRSHSAGGPDGLLDLVAAEPFEEGVCS